MLMIICLTILAYAIMGKSFGPLLDKLNNVDWRRKINDLTDTIKRYSLRVGRVAAKPVLQFWYVLCDAETTTTEKALIYGAIAYTIMPVSLIPRRIFGLLGILDEGASVLYVYKKVKSKITPEINAKVGALLDRWFTEYARYEVVE